MPRNGSGSYSLPQLPFSPGTTISSSAVNSDFSDIAAALTGSVAADGQTPITGSIKFASGSVSAPGIAFAAETNTGFRYASAGAVTVVGLGADMLTISATGLLNPNNAVLNPIGIIQDYAGGTAPAGWLLCYGQQIAQASYPELYAVCGTTYNTGGESAGNFRVPDLRGRNTQGKDNMGGSAANRITTAGCGINGTTLGAAGGEQTHTLLPGELASLTYNLSLVGTAADHTHGIGIGSGGTSTPGSGPPAPGVVRSGTFNSDGSGALALTFTTKTITTNSGDNPHNNAQPLLIVNKIIFAGR